MNAKVLFLVLFFSSGLFCPAARENIRSQDDVFNSIEIVSESTKPGAAFAIRLAKYHHHPVRFCMHQECLNLTNQWQLMSTSVDGSDLQPLMIESADYGWLLSHLHLEKNLFQLRAPFKLRLPTNVREKIENKDDQVAKERIFNIGILKTNTDKPWPCDWQDPLPKIEIVSLFGSFRTLPTGQVYSHKGMDIRAKMFTPVHAIADGKVLSAESQVIGGNNISVDHGHGVISRYFHLSKFEVEKNQDVKKDQVIALSGATGRVEAPHLHLEMRIRGTPVEPLTTLRLMSRLCDLK